MSKPLCSAVFSAVAMIVSAAACAQPRGGAGGEPSFYDEFDRFDGKRWYVSDNWSNGDHQGCTWSRANLSVSRSRLLLVLDKARAGGARAWRCAELRTVGRYGYGVYEARIRAAAGSGLNTAMFTYSGPPLTPVHDEIDFEFLGKSPGSVQLNYYVAGAGGHESIPALGFDASAGFHDYAFVWKPGRIDWYVDGRLVRSASDGAQPKMPGQFFLSLWNGSPRVDGWLGHFDGSRTPAAAEIDWIAFTRDGERCRFSQSLTCRVDTARP